jgi:D-alanyl-lipoteichoic acid acyltransferase DltB (MBOAT superfamily)
VDDVFADPAAFSTVDLIAGIYGYAVQIYCDFSAYSDIAIGVAALLGFSFPDNFNRPYRASSPRDFWRRWHISLSSWLRDYLYIPLGGSHHGLARTLFNLMVTMVLGGLWHGAAWRFVAWGALHGLALCADRLTGRAKKTAASKKTGLRKAAAVFLTFHFVCACWVFFRAPSFAHALEYFGALANVGIPATRLTPFVALLIGVGLAVHFIPDSWRVTSRKVFRVLPLPAQGLVAGIMLVVLSALSGEGVAPFIYFQF